jgi:hypothetical protein
MLLEKALKKPRDRAVERKESKTPLRVCSEAAKDPVSKRLQHTFSHPFKQP